MVEDSSEEIRVRFAPSPTGPLHIGGARTALFNYLFARKNGGRFILRIEDTDQERSKPEFEKDIIESLQWLGILWDEGPRPDFQGELGDYGPYRQSKRIEIYKKYAEKLLSEEKAYFCFCTPEEIKTFREYQIRQGLPPRYSGKCRNLSKKEIEEKFARGESAVLRLKVLPQKVKFKDLVRKEIEFNAELIGDFSLAKKRKEEFLPLYNFAAVVDDFEMKITHVIRGEDHLSNTPKQILIQKALGFPHPQYCHLPLILGPDKSKLSKRHGAVSINDYKKEGFLPEALLNFIAFLGWNPGTEREIFSLSSLVEEFSLERIQKGGAIFNIKKLEYLNGFYIRQKPIQKLTELCLPYLIEAGLIEAAFDEIQYPPAYGGKNLIPSYRVSDTKESISFESLQRIIGIYQERLKKLSEISELIDFFFKEKLIFDKDLLRWKETSDWDLKKNLKKAYKILSKIKPNDWQKDILEKVLIQEAQKLADRGAILWPLRVALTGKEASAPPFEILEILGKEKSLKRIREAIERI